MLSDFISRRGMAKLIFTSRYIRDAPPEHLQNYVRYISTREGVEKADESKKNLPATSAQKDLIRQLLKDMPESKDMLEYEDYRQRSTIGNASEFITQALERNLDMAAMKENYVDYLANRPRVERIGEHGLFTDCGEPLPAVGCGKAGNPCRGAERGVRTQRSCLDPCGQPAPGGCGKAWI